LVRGVEVHERRRDAEREEVEAHQLLRRWLNVKRTDREKAGKGVFMNGPIMISLARGLE
jgi:hypothetical protein